MTEYKVGIVFDTKLGRFKSDIQQGSKAMQQLGANADNAGRQFNSFSKNTDQATASLHRTNKVAAAVNRSIASLAAGVGGLSLAKGLTEQLAAFQDIRTRLQSLSESAADYADKERFLIELANEHHKELNGLADGYSRLSAIVQENIITDTQARNILAGLSDAASQNGASTADLERVYYGLSQALGQGVVQMQEVNQVVEPLPGLMSKLARAAGVETSAQLKKLVGDGKITSEVFGKLLVKALEDYEGAANKAANNINAKYRDIKREYQELAVALEQPIDTVLGASLDGIVRGLEFLQAHTETTITALQVGLVVAAGHAANAITRKTAATTKSTIADRAAAKATLVSAQADERAAVSAQHKAVQEQAAAQRQLSFARNTYQRTTAIKNLAIANSQVAATERNLAATRTTLTAATKRLSIAQKSLSLLSGVVGGLPGLLTIAGFAMYDFATRTSDAADETERLREETENLNPFANYTFETARGALQRYQGQLELAQQMAEEVQTRFENPFFKNVTAGDVAAANKEVEKLNEKITALQAIVNKKQPTQQTEDDNKPLVDLSGNKELAALEESLLSQEERIKASYVNRLAIVDKALVDRQISEQRHTELSTLLELKRDEDLRKIEEQAAERRRAEEQKRIDEGVARANELRQLQDQQRRDAWDLELAQAQGYHSLREAEEAAHQERLFQIRARKTGALQGAIVQFANFEKKTTLEKTSAVVALGEQGLAASAKQSKKAFAAYKAFSIAQALIKTYESATGAYAALAPIPIVGPALGAAAAGLAVATGLAQVNAIKSQKPSGFEQGGFIGNRSIVEVGERNQPEVLEFGGKNYLLGGNRGAVFNRAQLQNGSNKAGGVNVSVTLIEDSNRAGQVEQQQGLNGEDVIRIFVADIREGGDAASVLEQSFSLQRTGT